MVLPLQRYLFLAVAVIGIVFISYSMSVIRSAIRNGSNAHISRSPPVYSEEEHSVIVARTLLNNTMSKRSKPHLREEKTVAQPIVCFSVQFQALGTSGEEFCILRGSCVLLPVVRLRKLQRGVESLEPQDNSSLDSLNQQAVSSEAAQAPRGYRCQVLSQFRPLCVERSFRHS